MTKLETIEQLNAFIAENPHSLILKHSTACSISARAYSEFSSFIANASIPSAIILVIESRPVSNHLATLSGITHQSPQVLFFRQGKCCQSLSHHKITKQDIQAVLDPNNSGFIMGKSVFD